MYNLYFGSCVGGRAGGCVHSFVLWLNPCTKMNKTFRGVVFYIWTNVVATIPTPGGKKEFSFSLVFLSCRQRKSKSL